MSSKDNIFYLYEHIRNDSGQIFYVGKGCKNRAYSKHGRSEWWERVAIKHGYSVRIIADGLNEELAHFAEMERIDQLRSMGVRLCNITDGGDGVRIPIQKPEWNKKRSETLKGRVFSDDHLEKISAALKGRKFTDSHIRKIRSAAIAQSAERSRRLSGGNSPALNPEVAEKIRKTMTGRARSQESRLKQSATMKAEGYENAAKRDDVRRKISEKAKARIRPKGKCPHCHKEMLVSHLKRWHFDNCKSKPD